eukprot:4802100-Prymnesium_polylepis.1
MRAVAAARSNLGLPREPNSMMPASRARDAAGTSALAAALSARQRTGCEARRPPRTRPRRERPCSHTLRRRSTADSGGGAARIGAQDLRLGAFQYTCTVACETSVADGRWPMADVVARG